MAALSNFASFYRLILMRSPQVLCRASYCTSKSEPPKPATQTASKGKANGAPQTTTSGNTYESGQYYEHSEFTYYDIENDMAKTRVGQPPSPRAGEHC